MGMVWNGFGKNLKHKQFHVDIGWLSGLGMAQFELTTTFSVHACELFRFYLCPNDMSHCGLQKITQERINISGLTHLQI